MPDDRFDFPTPNFARPINNWLGLAQQQSAASPDAELAASMTHQPERQSRFAPVLNRIATWPGRIADTIRSGLTLPRDVYKGDVDPNSPEGMGRLGDMAALVPGGGMLAAERGALGMAGGRAMARPASRKAEAAAEAHPDWIDTRLPTGKNEIAVGEPGAPRIVDMDSLRATPELHDKNVDLVRNYPNLPKKIIKKDADTVSEAFIDHVKDNLLWLHDQVPSEVAARSQLWYEGGNKIVKDWAKKYDVSDSAAAGALAALSPQKDWYQNVSLANRVLHTLKGSGENWYQGATMTPEMVKTFRSLPSLNKPKYQGMFNDIKGRSLGDIDKMDATGAEKAGLKALWVRLHDQAHNSPSYPLVTPEGGFGEMMTNQPTGKQVKAGLPGSESKAGWGSLTEISKAIRSIQNDPEGVSKLMGEKHKVRNFYNNLLDPNSPRGDVTIDTHAVAAGLLRPLSGDSLEVAHNFANYPGAGLPSAGGSANTGIQGTYPLYAEAYRRAAAERGLLPRQMQSITWEAIRGMFPDTFKSAANNAKIDAIWRQYRDGRANLNDTREAIHDLAGGIRNPSWFRPGAGSDEALRHPGNP